MLITSLLDTKAVIRSCLRRKQLCATLGHRSGQIPTSVGKAGRIVVLEIENFSGRSSLIGGLGYESFTAGLSQYAIEEIGKSNAWRSQAEPVTDFHAYLRAPDSPVAGGCALPASSARLSDQLRQCAVQDEEQPGQAFLGNFATGPLMAVIAAYGRCGSSCAPRTQKDASPSPRIPDAVSKNTVRLKLMTLRLDPGGASLAVLLLQHDQAK